MFPTTTLLNHKYVNPWGSYEFFHVGKHFRVKKLILDPKSGTSYHLHRNRDEYLTIIDGNGKIVIGKDVPMDLKPGDTVFVPKGVGHSIFGGEDGLVVLEQQMGDCDELDEDRLSDASGRPCGYLKDIAEKGSDKFIVRRQKRIEKRKQKVKQVLKFFRLEYFYK